MDATQFADTLDTLTTASLLGLGIFIIGLENRYPIVANRPFKARLRHLGANLGIWLFSLVLVDYGFGKTLFSSSFFVEHSNRGLLNAVGLPWFWTVAIAFLALDFAAYAFHYVLHRSPWLWRFHVVHHSDVDVDLSTTFRVHPVESALALVWFALVLVSLGIPFWVVALRELAKLPLVLLQHANVCFPERAERILGAVLMTPGMHKIHHSPRRQETDSNYGVCFSFWDRLCGTLNTGPSVAGPRYGLGYLGEGQWQTVTGMLKTPWSRRLAASVD